MTKVFDPKVWSLFSTGSGAFRPSWIVFSDSSYQKLPPTPFHIASSRCYVPFPYFHVSHATIRYRLILKSQLRHQSIPKFNLDHLTVNLTLKLSISVMPDDKSNVHVAKINFYHVSKDWQMKILFKMINKKLDSRLQHKLGRYKSFPFQCPVHSLKRFIWGIFPWKSGWKIIFQNYSRRNWNERYETPMCSSKRAKPPSSS